eukprot:Amastigsp_a176370_44.p3 type:complete len:122 gc:universal Amastigsp_a176370_44:370-5(-)
MSTESLLGFLRLMSEWPFLHPIVRDRDAGKQRLSAATGGTPGMWFVLLSPSSRGSFVLWFAREETEAKKPFVWREFRFVDEVGSVVASALCHTLEETSKLPNKEARRYESLRQLVEANDLD